MSFAAAIDDTFRHPFAIVAHAQAEFTGMIADRDVDCLGSGVMKGVSDRLGRDTLAFVADQGMQRAGTPLDD